MTPKQENSLQNILSWSYHSCWTALLFLSVASSGAIADQNTTSSKNLSQEKKIPNLASLNIRLSHRPVQPPKSMIKKTLELPDVRAARVRIGPSPQAAILEDDDHNRVIILSSQEDGRIVANLLVDLNLKPVLTPLIHCTQERQCAYDRMPVTGGLGCIAICLQKFLDPENQP